MASCPHVSDFGGRERWIGGQRRNGSAGLCLRCAEGWKHLVSHQSSRCSRSIAQSLQLGPAQLNSFHADSFRDCLWFCTASCPSLVGLLYGAMLPMFPRRPIVLGGLIAPVLWSGLLYTILGLLNPLLASHIDWFWFIASQVAFGIVAGLVVVRQSRMSDPRECVVRSTRRSRSSRNSFRHERAERSAVSRIPISVCIRRARRLYCSRLAATPHGQPQKGSEIVAPNEVVDFGTLYAQNCAGCHGAEGRGGAAIALANPVYLAIVDEASMRKVVANGVRGTSMPAFAQSAGGMLTDKQIDVITSGMRSRWSTPGILDGANPPSYAAKSAGDAARGESRVSEHIAHPVTDPKATVDPKASAITQRFVSCAGQRSGTAHDRHHRPSGTGRARLARKRSRQSRCPTRKSPMWSPGWRRAACRAPVSLIPLRMMRSTRSLNNGHETCDCPVD